MYQDSDLGEVEQGIKRTLLEMINRDLMVFNLTDCPEQSMMVGGSQSQNVSGAFWTYESKRKRE